MNGGDNPLSGTLRPMLKSSIDDGRSNIYQDKMEVSLNLEDGLQDLDMTQEHNQTMMDVTDTDFKSTSAKIKATKVSNPTKLHLQKNKSMQANPLGKQSKIPLYNPGMKQKGQSRNKGLGNKGHRPKKESRGNDSSALSTYMLLCNGKI